MQLTKTLEKNILKSYNKWLDSYLNGDVVTYDSYFDDAYHFIGSTNNEEFLTREDTTNFFKPAGAVDRLKLGMPQLKDTR